jgi:hypothetical protein
MPIFSLYNKTLIMLRDTVVAQCSGRVLYALVAGSTSVLTQLVAELRNSSLSAVSCLPVGELLETCNLYLLGSAYEYCGSRN